MGKGNGRIRKSFANAACAIGGIIVAGLLVMDWGGSAATLPHDPEIRYVQQADIVDEPDQSILSASFTPTLVQAGTTSPYTGNGLPGIYLTVEAEASVLPWTVVGWANQTKASQFCEVDYVYFSNYDWTFETRGSGSSSGFFKAVPSTVPARLLLGGDQCFMRIGEGGNWDLTICIEAGGLPRGIYDDPDGSRHVDRWDRCVEKVVKV